MSEVEILISSLNRRTRSALDAFSNNPDQEDQHRLYNLSVALKNFFKIGLLCWRRGDVKLASESLRQCVSNYNVRVSEAERFGSTIGDQFWVSFWEGNSQVEAFPASAAYLTGADFAVATCPPGISRHGEEGFQPWFDGKLIFACTGQSNICSDEFERSLKIAENNKGYPAHLLNLTEFHFEVLTGQWKDRPSSEMLDRHSELYANLKKLRGSPDLIYGEQEHNERVVDWVFACILKRIGWSGRYLHSWPDPGEPVELGGARETIVEPSRFIETV